MRLSEHGWANTHFQCHLLGGGVLRRHFVSACALLGVLSVLFAVGCGGNGPSSPPISVAITSPASPATIQAAQTMNVVASVSSDMSNSDFHLGHLHRPRFGILELHGHSHGHIGSKPVEVRFH